MFIKPSSQTIQLQQFNSTNVQSRSGRAQPTLFCKANPPPCALFIKSQQKVMHSPGVSASCVSSLHDPITWSEEERVAEYRVLAARYARWRTRKSASLSVMDYSNSLGTAKLPL